MSILHNNPHLMVNQLRANLLKARKERDTPTVETLQAVVSAIDNASAAPVPKAINSVGVGSTEIPRRELSAQDIETIVKNEITEMQQAIAEFDNQENDFTKDLHKKIVILENYVDNIS